MALDINALYGSLTDNELAGLSSAREMNAAFPITRNGVVYNFLPDGAIETIAPTDATLEGRSTGATLGLFSPTGEAIVEPYFNESYGETSGSQMLGQALIGATLGGMLGPAGFGLATPAAAAAGSGLTAFGTSGGDVEAALKAAALGGAAAYGIETLFPGASTASVNPDVAFNVANLAAQGVPEEQIAQILAQEGVANEVINSALDAQFGVSAPGSARGLEFPSAPSGAEQVSVASQASQPGLLSTAAPAIAPAATGLLGAQSFPVPSESVQVQTTTAPAETQVSAPVAAATGGLLAPTQKIAVQAQNIPTQTQATTPAASAVGTLAPKQTVPVEDRIIKREEPQVYVSTPAGTVTTPRGDIPVSEVKLPPGQPSTETPSMLPLLGLLGLGAAGAGLLNQENAAPFDQAAYDAIAKGRSPVYPRGEFTPISLGGLPGMGGISDGMLGAYDYFGPYYGAGRFGARPQAFALPGLLGPQMMSIPTTPIRSAAV